MGKDSLKYNSNTELKKRSSIGSHSSGVSYSKLIGFSNHLPKTKKIEEKNLGNGFVQILIKK